LIGGYRIEGEIARGGMGIVLRAHDERFQRSLAVKVLQEKYRGNAEVARRFLEEAQVMGQLQHPGIPPVYDLGALPDGRPFFALKLIKGRTLAELLHERPHPAHDLARWVALFGQVCQAVAYAHSRGILHRDLKPSNVMVGAFGEVQVMDWGLAKVHKPLSRCSRDIGPAKGTCCGQWGCAGKADPASGRLVRVPRSGLGRQCLSQHRTQGRLAQWLTQSWVGAEGFHDLGRVVPLPPQRLDQALGLGPQGRGRAARLGTLGQRLGVPQPQGAVARSRNQRLAVQAEG
jgi:serine/threonine protein kinase